MATTGDKIKEIVAYGENKGPYGLLAAIVTAVMVLAQLTPEQVVKIREFWPLLNTPAGIMIVSLPSIWSIKMLIGGSLKAYLEEQRNRTKVETGIYNKLEQLAEDFKVICANHLEDRNYFDLQLNAISRRFDRVDASINDVYKIVEKRREYSHGDTETFKK